jgi:hypothetical protein
MLQCYPVQEFHRQECIRISFANFVDGADVRMIERRRSPCFPAETFKRVRVLRNVVGQEFEGNEAAQLSVLRFVHHAHAPAPEFLNNTIAGNHLADHEEDEGLW